MEKAMFQWKNLLALTTVGFLLSSNAWAQFTGPAATGTASTVAQAQAARINSYVTVTGHIVNHLRENYYTFRDNTGDMRIEIEQPVWKNRQVGPDTLVRLQAEVDVGLGGNRYLWVESLQIVK
ncbi:NirD/YgiW/YdeI family stress tolerance protein [Hydrogenophaga sp.]|uniref:NirD/YgiW/YdeI family stress tolerance protein n=1 Tax=Hydrogenophaga sp. TaxID=1904254 RepID=UPI0025C6C8A8|nr:NirD/YgiW/YdeI family stress tolerance protein [Hydrogenophaga sp.]